MHDLPEGELAARQFAARCSGISLVDLPVDDPVERHRDGARTDGSQKNEKQKLVGWLFFRCKKHAAVDHWQRKKRMLYFDEIEESFQSVAAKMRDVSEIRRASTGQLPANISNLPKKNERVKEGC